jgi:hypothetical protein
MLIQKFVRPDSIVASQRLLADFCNKIGPKRRCRDVRFRAAIGGKADVKRV